jgi:hypothetical protein
MVEFSGQKLFQISLIFFKLIVSPMQFAGGQSGWSVWLQKQILTITMSFLVPFLQKKQITVVIVVPFI